mmetsp:Transcript_23314/g.35987  ORF Transcript_23314/g.35987 Transcript_23314/m.35987 type:complete len:93 (-) Transcript_23314:1698-1976(-)
MEQLSSAKPSNSGFSNGQSQPQSHKFTSGPTKAGSQPQQLVEPTKKKVIQRPFSGGIQKLIKDNNHPKSRVANLNQKNFSMYEHKASSIAQS